MATVRLFIAIEIPPDIKSAIAALQQQLKSTHADVRWETQEQFHITLKFLGRTDEAKLQAMFDSLQSVAQKFSMFSVKYSSLGCFPNRHNPRIIWVGADDNPMTLIPFAEAIDSSMTALGFDKEEKKFHPHATIGRVKSTLSIRDLLRRMESLTFESQPTQVSQIVLIKSELKQSGSVYTRIKTFPLYA